VNAAEDDQRAAAGHVTRCITAPPKAWSPAIVEERLRKAAALRAALTSDRFVDALVAGREPESVGIFGGIGSPLVNDGGDSVVAGATEALSWLRWLEADDAGILGARLEGASWKSICWRYGISRPTADRRFRYALALIVWRLNGNARTASPPSLRSLLGMRRAA
jgi:hypothetical protein